MSTPLLQYVVVSTPDTRPGHLSADDTVSSVNDTAGSTAAGGVISSRLVTRDESDNGKGNTGRETALIDWLAFTVPRGNGIDWRWMRDCLKFVFNISPETWTGTNRKYSGYRHKVDLIHTGQMGETVNLGLVAYGGESQDGTLHASLNGTACARIDDWQQVMEWGESVGAVIKRVDCAHDDFMSEVLNIRQALDWYAQGMFSMNGRPPTARLIDDMGSGKGKTLNIGNRQHGNLLRIYEKGKQEGDPDSPWVRAEVEYRNKSREIPWDVVINPGHYLAGTYPCLGYLSTIQSRIKTIRQVASINYDAMVKNTRTSAGKAINVILRKEGSADAVIELVRRDGTAKCLEPYIGFDGALVGKPHDIADC